MKTVSFSNVRAYISGIGWVEFTPDQWRVEYDQSGKASIVINDGIFAEAFERNDVKQVAATVHPLNS
jgi:hypothetical protein